VTTCGAIRLRSARQRYGPRCLGGPALVTQPTQGRETPPSWFEYGGVFLCPGTLLAVAIPAASSWPRRSWRPRGSPHSRALASGLRDAKVHIHDVPTGGCIGIENSLVVIIPFAGWTRSGGALEKQVVAISIFVAASPAANAVSPRPNLPLPPRFNGPLGNGRPLSKFFRHARRNLKAGLIIRGLTRSGLAGVERLNAGPW
jgi:hypothetical protein